MMIVNAQQKRKYDLFLKRINYASNNLYANDLLIKNANLAYAFSQKQKIVVPDLLFLPGWQSQHYQPKSEIDHWLKLQRGLEDHKLYYVNRRDDFDVGLDPSSTADEVENWRFGALPIIAVVAIVIAVGALARSIYLETKTIEIKNKLRHALDTADKLISKSDPATKRMWENAKKDGEWDKNNEVAGFLPQIGQSITSGLKWGAAIGIPVLVFMITRALDR